MITIMTPIPEIAMGTNSRITDKILLTERNGGLIISMATSMTTKIIRIENEEFFVSFRQEFGFSI